MKNSRLVLRIGAVGAAIAALMMVIMALLPWPFTFDIPGEEVISGSLVLSPAEFERFVDSIRLILIFDNIFLICWFIGWLGLGSLIRNVDKLLGNIVLILGLLGAFFDFTENTIVWALIRCKQLSINVESGWFIAWEVVVHLSYLLPYTSAVIALSALWHKNVSYRIISIIGVMLTILAIAGKYIPELTMVSYIWFLLWFIFIGILLWKHAAKMNPELETQEGLKN